MFMLEPSACWVRGSIDRTANGEVLPIRPGSESRAEVRDGTPGNLRDPVRAHVQIGRWASQPTSNAISLFNKTRVILETKGAQIPIGSHGPVI
jgi:hypothetical protein